MFDSIARQLLQFRAALLVLLGVMAVAALSQLPKLELDFTPQQLFESVSGDYDYREEFAARYGREDNIVFVRVAAEDIYDPAVLQKIGDATRALDALPEVELAESIVTMPIARSDGGSLNLGPIPPDDEPITAAVAAELREALSNEPLAVGRLVNEGGTKTLLVARLDADLQSIEELRNAQRTVEAAATDHLEGLDWKLRGLPVMRTRVVDALFSDQLLFVPLIGLIYALVLAFLFRRFSGIVLPLAVVGFSVLCLLGVMAALGASINIINNVLPALVFVIAASDSIHMLQRDAEENERAGSRLASVHATLRHTGLACLLTTVTTAVGFYSLGAADSRLLREFSWEAGTGVLFAFLATICIFAVLAPMLPPVKRQWKDEESSSELFETLGRAVLAAPKRVLLVAAVPTIIASVLATTVRVDALLLDIFGDDAEAYAITHEVESEFGGVLPIEVSLEGRDRHTFSDPQRYAKLHELQKFASSDKAVLSTQSIVDLHQPIRAKLLDDPEQRTVMPGSVEEIMQIQLLLDQSPEGRRATESFVHDEFQNARVLVRVADVGGQRLRELSANLDEKLRELFGGDESVNWRFSGDAYVAARSFDAFINDLLESLAGAFFVIFLIMLAVFRSLRLAIVAMIPNTVPLIGTAAYMALADVALDVTTTTTFAIGLGLAVDDTIHFIARFREESADKPPYEALVATYAGAGRAIVLTSILLLAGMAVLQLSAFAPTQTFSTLMILTIAGALFADLLILPPLLLVTSRRQA